MAYENLKRPWHRAIGEEQMRSLRDAIARWLENPPTEVARWTLERRAWIDTVRRWLAHAREFRPSRLFGDDPSAMTTLAVVAPPADREANFRNVDQLEELLRRLTELPPARSSAEQPPVDPRDGDGWADAVARQGVIVTYDGYLRSTHWQLLVAERKTGICDRCHRRKGTQLHHVTYERLGAELPTDTRELCDACHRREHPRQLKLAA